MPCPRCNHPQPFGMRKQKVGEDQYELFIQCKKCKKKEVIFTGNSDMIKTYQEIQKLRVRAQKDPKLKKLLITKEKRLKHGKSKQNNKRSTGGNMGRRD